MINIVLCGFMGSGKTTVGKKLANMLNMKFVDTDNLIEKQEGMTIADIFEQKGEAYFREKEYELVFKLKELSNTVIATGGGFPINQQVFENIKSIGTVVLLDVLDKTVLKRVFGDEMRPKIANKSAQEVISLYNTRKPKYYAAADIIIPADSSATQVALKIISEVQK